MKEGDLVSYLGTGVMRAKMGARARVIGFKNGWVVLRWVRWNKKSRAKCLDQQDGAYVPENFKVVKP